MSKYAVKLGVTVVDEGTQRPVIKLGVTIKLGVSVCSVKLGVARTPR